MKLAYLCSEYPGISHTFIFREVLTLRALGWTVATASVRRPAALERMTLVEQADAADTIYLKDKKLVRLLREHLALAGRSPLGYGRMLWTALTVGGRASGLSWRQRIGYFLEAGVLRGWLRRQGIEHVHVHFANPAATVALVATAAGGGMNFSLSIHGPDEFSRSTEWLLAEKVRRAVWVRCISNFCRSQVMALLPSGEWGKLQVVHCGVDVAQFTPRLEPRHERPELLCVGRLVPVKGQCLLLQACAELQRRGTAFHLTLVGDGPDRTAIERLVQVLGLTAHVSLAGAVGQERVQEFYAEADIFVLPSFAEGVPVVLMEAMAREIPVLSTRIAGIPELIHDGVNGVLVTPGDLEALVTALAALLADAPRRRELGRRGRQTVVNEFNLQPSAQEMARCFERYAV